MLLLALAAATIASLSIDQCVSLDELGARVAEENLIGVMNDGPSLNEPMRLIYLLQRGQNNSGYLITSSDGSKFCKTAFLTSFNPFRFIAQGTPEEFSKLKGPSIFINQRLKVYQTGGFKPIFDVWVYTQAESEGHRSTILAKALEKGAPTRTIVSNRAGTSAGVSDLTGYIRSINAEFVKAITTPAPLTTKPQAQEPLRRLVPAWCSQAFDVGGSIWTGAELDAAIRYYESPKGAAEFKQKYRTKTKSNEAEASEGLRGLLKFYRLTRKDQSGYDAPQCLSK